MKKNFLLAVMSACFAIGSYAQNEKSLELGLGYGLYRQNASMGTNLSFSTDYRVNNRYSVGQMSQFGFMHSTVGTYKANYVNQHISVIVMRKLLTSKRFDLSAGTGLGYTNYHTVKVSYSAPKSSSDTQIIGTYYSTYSQMQLSFPVVADFSYKISKTVSIGARFGGYIPTHGGYFNYKFLNPHLKFSL